MLAAGAILGITMYRSSAQLVEQSMGMQAQAVAQRAVELIDTAQYAALSTGQNQTEYYAALRAQLSQLREANGLKYLYTLGKREENGTSTYFMWLMVQPQMWRKMTSLPTELLKKPIIRGCSTHLIRRLPYGVN